MPLKNNYKSGSAIKDLGCTVDKLKLHLESKFKLGMTWDNHGEWHYDHIIPLCSATTYEEVIKLNHYIKGPPHQL